MDEVLEKLKEVEERFEHFADEHNPRDKTLRDLHRVSVVMAEKLLELEERLDAKPSDPPVGPSEGAVDRARGEDFE